MPLSDATLTCTSVSPECPVEATVYGYYPSLAANSIFAAIFLACTITQLGLGWRYKSWTYSRFVALACLLECLGYIGRILLNQNPWSNAGFEIQICTLIMAPAFLAASIYITLKHIIRNLTPNGQYSLLPPAWYTPLFMSGDAVCLILQAVGGATAATASSNLNQLSIGSKIMLTGIIVQVFVSLVFIFLAGTYAVRLLMRSSSLSDNATNLLRSFRFRFFLASLTFSFLAIFARCAYRIAEMASGWGNAVMRDQTGFIVLDGVMCALAAVALTVFNPGWCFPQMQQGAASQDLEAGTEKEDSGDADL